MMSYKGSSDVRMGLGIVAVGTCIGAGIQHDLYAAERLASKKPNFLFVYTDDHSWDSMGCVQKVQGDAGRYPWLKTPNMDRLAAEGVRFNNAFVTHSLCTPARSAFLTGQYNRVHGVQGNTCEYPANNVSYSSLMTEAGYKTGYFGKWHHHRQSGKRPGFSTSASFLGQGKFMDEPFEIDGVKTPTKGYIDDVTTDFAIKFIEENRDNPFLAVVGFKAVHGPRTPRPSDENLYVGEKYRTTPNSNLTPPFKKDEPSKDEKVPEWKPLSKDGAKYFQCINGADFNLGRLLEALDRLGLVENTVVVYTTDNGLFFDEHRLGDKRYAYEGSIRIPFLLRYPRMAAKGSTSDKIILNIDVAPTFLELAGLKVPETMQGWSLKPILEGKAPEDWRKSFFYEYLIDREYPKVPPVQAVRTENAKLIRYPGNDDWTEMFDLKADPYETKNIFNDENAAGLRKELEGEFKRIFELSQKPQRFK